jgi:hypothetical protein
MKIWKKPGFIIICILVVIFSIITTYNVSQNANQLKRETILNMTDDFWLATLFQFNYILNDGTTINEGSTSSGHTSLSEAIFVNPMDYEGIVFLEQKPIDRTALVDELGDYFIAFYPTEYAEIKLVRLNDYIAEEDLDLSRFFSEVTLETDLGKLSMNDVLKYNAEILNLIRRLHSDIRESIFID